MNFESTWGSNFRDENREPNLHQPFKRWLIFYTWVLICRPSGERGSRNTRNRYLRSSYCCSVYPAVHNSYRALLRSSSICEPSDPPLRVIKLISTLIVTFTTLVSFINGNQTNKQTSFGVVRGQQRIPMLGITSRNTIASHSQTGKWLSHEWATGTPIPIARWYASSKLGIPTFCTNNHHLNAETKFGQRRIFLAKLKPNHMITWMIHTQVHLRIPCYDFYFL